MTQKNTRNSSPVIGLSTIVISILFSIATLIYVGAGSASVRINELSTEQQIGLAEPVWWDKSLVFICPLH